MASFGQIRSSSGRQLDYTPQGWIDNEGQNLNAAPGAGQLSDLVGPQRMPPQMSLSDFLMANNTSMQNLVDYNGKKAFRTPDGGFVWQNPDGTIGRAQIVNPQQQAFESAQRQAEKEKLDLSIKRAQLAAGGSATPHLTEIVDPQDPTKMLRIDVSKYRGGSIGSSGVVGVSGKEPTAAAREAKAEAVDEKKLQGQQEFSSELNNLQTLYNKLNEKKAIPSTRRSGVSNLVSSIQASSPGQFTGSLMGTEEQQLRDEIASGRMRLMQALKAATGMSAQQMNSNVELQTILNSLGDPSKSYEANSGIIEQMRERYGGGDSRTVNNARDKSSTDYQQTLFNAKKALANNPAAREGILNKMRAAGYDTEGL